MNKLYYLACPYSTGLSEFVSKEEAGKIMKDRHEKATAVAAYLFQRGYHLYSPITHGFPLEKYLPVEVTVDWHRWMASCHNILARCDGLFVLKLPMWDKSKGVAEEIAAARKMGKDIVYLTPSFDGWGWVEKLEFVPENP